MSSKLILSDDEALELNESVKGYLEDIRAGIVLPKELSDITRLLQINNDNFNKFKEEIWFKKAWVVISGKRGKLTDTTITNLTKIQIGVLKLLGELLEDTSSLKDDFISVLTRIDQLQIESLELKAIILKFNEKYNDRFIRLRKEIEETRWSLRLLQALLGFCLIAGSILIFVPGLSAQYWHLGLIGGSIAGMILTVHLVSELRNKKKSYIPVRSTNENNINANNSKAIEKVLDFLAIENQLVIDQNEQPRDGDIQNVDMLKRQAREGNSDAEYKLALLYANGRGVKKNLKIAFDWALKSAEHGNCNAQYYVSRHYYYAIQADLLNAQRSKRLNKLASYKEECLKWLNKAAENGNIKAMLTYGKFLYYGNEVLSIHKNSSLAEYWIERSANSGNAEAQCIYYSILIDNDQLDEAKKIILKSAAQGCPDAIKIIVKDEIGEPEERFEYIIKASAKGDINSKIMLADCYVLGIGTPQDIPEAAHIYSTIEKDDKIETKYRIRALFRGDFLGIEYSNIYVAPLIPAKKKLNAITYAQKFGEFNDEIIFLHDSTIWGSGKKGFIITDNSIYTCVDDVSRYELSKKQFFSYKDNHIYLAEKDLGFFSSSDTSLFIEHLNKVLEKLERYYA